jgi:hypothetical protein
VLFVLLAIGAIVLSLPPTKEASQA